MHKNAIKFMQYMHKKAIKFTQYMHKNAIKFTTKKRISLSKGIRLFYITDFYIIEV